MPAPISPAGHSANIPNICGLASSKSTGVGAASPFGVVGPLSCTVLGQVVCLQV